MKKLVWIVRHINIVLFSFCFHIFVQASENVFTMSPTYACDVCDLTATISVSSPNPGIVCIGDSITLTANPILGVGPFTYIWSNGQTTQSITFPAPFIGDLNVLITGADGCSAFATIHIKIRVWKVDINIPFSGPTCLGDSVELIAGPSIVVAGTTFLWSTGETSQGIFVTTSGTYSVTMTNPAIPCFTADTVLITILPVAGPDPQIIGPAILCPGQTATLSVSGGPYSYYFWELGGNLPTMQISGPGSYNVYVENAEGCSGRDTIDIISGNILPPILDAPFSLCSGATGNVEVLNAADYTLFNWNTGETTPIITINGPGIYIVTVTESGGCTAIGSIIVETGSSNFSITGITTPVTSCASPDGSINITVTPSGTYTFNWSNGQNTEDISSLPEGGYTVTITDIGGCTSSAFYAVVSNVTPPGLTTIVTSSSCSQSNGSIDLSVSPAGSYTFFWSTGATTEDLSNIFAATYSVTVTATSNGCTATASVTVPNNNSVINITGNSTPLTSCTSSNGARDITPAPSGVYTFVWSSGETTEDLTNLSTGNYTVTVSSSAGCTAIATYSVVNNTTSPVPVATPSPATCGQSNGAI
ncbi:MAG: hypothetical protein WBB31_07940, partial [Saprospiraceae bacterium]